MVCFTLLRSPLVSSKPAPFLSRSRGQTSRRSPGPCWSLTDVYTRASLGTADHKSIELVLAAESPAPWYSPSRKARSRSASSRVFSETSCVARNALFLDGGSATGFYSPELGRNSNLVPLGPMIGVYERTH